MPKKKKTPKKGEEEPQSDEEDQDSDDELTEEQVRKQFKQLKKESKKKSKNPLMNLKDLYGNGKIDPKRLEKFSGSRNSLANPHAGFEGEWWQRAMHLATESNVPRADVVK